MSKSNRRLQRNRRHAMLGGVCAGLADYFCIDRLIVRILFVIAAFTWPLAIVAYIVLYFCMQDDRPVLDSLNEDIGNSKVGKHFKNVDYSKRLYKNRQQGKVSGVCAGVADYFEVNPFFVRLALVGSLFFGPFGIIAYVIAAIVMDENPDSLRTRRGRHNRSSRQTHHKESGYTDRDDTANGYYSRTVDKRDLQACDEKLSSVEKKLRRLEATITSRKFKLHNELKNI